MSGFALKCLRGSTQQCWKQTKKNKTATAHFAPFRGAVIMSVLLAALFITVLIVGTATYWARSVITLSVTQNFIQTILPVIHAFVCSSKRSIFHWNIHSVILLVITCIYLRNKFRHTYLCDYQHSSIKLTNYSLKKKKSKIKALQTVGANYLLGGEEQEGWMLLRLQEKKSNLPVSASGRNNQSRDTV